MRACFLNRSSSMEILSRFCKALIKKKNSSLILHEVNLLLLLLYMFIAMTSFWAYLRKYQSSSKRYALIHKHEMIQLKFDIKRKKNPSSKRLSLDNTKANSLLLHFIQTSRSNFIIFMKQRANIYLSPATLLQGSRRQAALYSVEKETSMLTRWSWNRKLLVRKLAKAGYGWRRWKMRVDWIMAGVCQLAL